MNTIEKLGDEETFRNIVERTITEFEDSEIEGITGTAFRSCGALTRVSLPLAKNIGYEAFHSCTALTSISLPLVKSIESSTFTSCGALTSISLPSVTAIKDDAFASCTALTSISLPSVTSIGKSTFRYCGALTSISLPSVTSIKERSFWGCNKLTTMYIGTKSDTVCTLSNKDAIPSDIGAIYVPYNLQEQYKTATNWSSFASKIQAYETPVLCQSLTITAEDILGYQTPTVIHYEAVCTYSIEGIMQTGTKIFKGDAVSDTFGTNPSGESSRQIEVSYTFLGQTATTTITQDKYIGNPVGGKIYYIDDTADGTYSFYDAEGNLMSDVAVGSTPSYYKVLTTGSKDKYYVYNDELYAPFMWGMYNIKTGASGTTIGTGKSNTVILLATDASTNNTTIWYKLQQVRNTYKDGNNDWFVPSKDEVEELRLAVKSGSITGGMIAGSSYNGSAFKTFNGYLYSSSESSSSAAWIWACGSQGWPTNYSKEGKYSVFFVRAF